MAPDRRKARGRGKGGALPRNYPQRKGKKVVHYGEKPGEGGTPRSTVLPPETVASTHPPEEAPIEMEVVAEVHPQPSSG